MEYKDILSYSPKTFELVYRGKLKYIDNNLSNLNYLNKVQAIKISQAFSDVNSFNNTKYETRISKESAIEKTVRIANSDGISREIIRKNILGR